MFFIFGAPEGRPHTLDHDLSDEGYNAALDRDAVVRIVAKHSLELEHIKQVFNINRLFESRRSSPEPESDPRPDFVERAMEWHRQGRTPEMRNRIANTPLSQREWVAFLAGGLTMRYQHTAADAGRQCEAGRSEGGEKQEKKT